MIPSLSTGQAQGGNILIVDDVDANLKLLANLLTHAGYHVRPAGSATLALRSVQAQPPDLVLLDVRMPDIDGYELCRRLKADERTCAIPVIFISASVGVEERAEGFEAGAVDFISKPFNEAEVLARVATHLALYHARQELERNNAQLTAEVAERQQAQEAVQKERQRLAGIIEGTNVGTWEWNVQTGETIFNDRWARIIGYTLDEIAPVSIDTWMRYAHPDDLTASDELLQKHFRGELDYYEFESRMRHKNGSWIWVLDRGKVTSWTADGKPLLMMGTHQDITKSKQAEEHLREQAQNYATLADSGRALVWTAGTDKLCDYFNRIWLEFTGRSLEQERGNGWAEGVHPDDLQRCLDIYIGAFDRRDAFSMEYRLRRHDGEYRWILDDGSPRYNAKGEFIGYIGHCLDITDRKRTEEAIQRERLFADAVFESVPGILYVYDDQSKLVRWNKKHETVTGYSAEELSRMTSPEWHPEEERAEVARAVEAILATGHGMVEAHLLTKDGRNPLMQLNGVRLDLDGKTYFVGIGLDITERKKLERDVAHLASFPAQNPNPVLEVETGGAVFFVNAAATAALAQLGLDPDPRQFLPGTPEELVLLRSQCEQGPQTRELRLGEATFLRVVTAPPGQSSLLRVYALDITERKRAEEALAASRAALFEGQAIAHVGDWSVDTTNRRFVWSAEMYAIHGLKPGTPISHETYLELIHPEDRKRVFGAMGFAMAGRQQEFSVDYRIVRPDGSVRFVTLTGQTVLDDGGAVTGIRGTTQDITNRKAAEAEKEAMQEQLQQSRRLESVGQLAGGVAHNFNNLLTGIMGSVEIARMDVVPGSPAASSLEMARAAAIKAAGLARQLSSFGRNALVQPVVQNTTNAVLASLELVCSSLPSSIEVVRDLTPDTWDVLVDSSQLTQVLLELMNNAREAMSDEGTITIHTSNVTVDSMYAATYPYARTGDFAVISVVDTGPGIDPGIMEHLFEPFATTRQFGRGMGLAMVFGSVKQAGGWVGVSSKQGAGTEVNLYLPRITEEPIPPA